MDGRRWCYLCWLWLVYYGHGFVLLVFFKFLTKVKPNKKAEILIELEMEDLIINQAPKLHALVDRVREIPETMKYIENFKDTKTIVHSLFKQ